MTATPLRESPEEEIWSPSAALSPRVRRLREQYWSFYDRNYTNEVRAFTTGTPWDEVYPRWSWSNVPEMMMFLDGARAYLLADARRVALPADFFAQPLVVRRALLFARVVEQELPAQILDGELVAGSHFSVALSLAHTRTEARRYQRLERRFLARARKLDELGAGNCGAIPGHLIPDYPRVLREGFAAITAEARAALEAPASSREQRELARAIVISGEAMRTLASRYAAEARRLAAREPDPDRREELEVIAAACDHVPWRPARSFTEALQSLWLAHMGVLIAESYPGPGVSPGRIDQYLYPYYHTDLESGRTDAARAREWLQCLFIKFNYAYDYQGWTGTNQGINSSFGQLITLGGIDASGADASNELTDLILEVIESLNLLEPKPNVRLHAGTPERLLTRLVEMMARAQGSPFLLNFDEKSMEGLRWEGLPESRLWDYAPVGCLENTLQGDDRSGTVDVNLNLAKAVELALNDGRDQATGARLGPRTGDPRRFRSYDDLASAFRRQLEALAATLIEANNLADALRARFAPTPYVSALVGGCLESGRDITAGGARHGFITVEGVGLATAADSLAAVKHLVFDERRVGMEELLRALADNFDGREPLRRMLLNKAPKFGNQQSRADEIARDVSRTWTEAVFRRMSPATGRRYRGGYLSWNYWVAYAPRTAATPDGRRRGQPLSNGVCPVNGADREGPTAVIQSVGRLGLETAPNGASHTMSFSPSLLRSEEGRRKLAALLRAYGKVGGTCLQLNIVSPETLRRAQADPDAYRNLLVRVTGYNAYFVMLGKEIQDEIIARESHTVA